MIEIPPWYMCSKNEAFDRCAIKELSSFESTQETYILPPMERKPDPSLCVKKYRRSAAGGGAKIYDDDIIRSLEQLEMTVDFLIHVWMHQKSRIEMQKALFLQTVNFVDDRLRAVQVDLTILLGNKDNRDDFSRVRRLQAKIIRYNILSQYLLSNSNKYEWKFAQTALTTAISSYFATLDHVKDHNDYHEIDEIMSYSSLLHLSTVIRGQESALPITSSMDKKCGLTLSDGEGISAILSLHKKFSIKFNSHELNMRKKYMWALNLVSEYENGNYLSFLRMLSDEHMNVADFKWGTLIRCCIAQVLPIVRIGLMRQYNKSFGNEEKVSGKDLKKLLHFPSEDVAITFCEDIGLPTTASMNDGKHDCVIMKVAPISIHADVISKMINPGRSEDEFVFGRISWFQTWKSLPDSAWDTETDREKKEVESKMSSLQNALAKMVLKQDPESTKPDIRVDGDGVLIPPPTVIQQLVY